MDVTQTPYLPAAPAPPRKRRKHLSVSLAFACLCLVVLLFSVVVYVLPTMSGQDTTGAFDAFTYAKFLAEDPEFIFERQPFLGAYPWGVSPTLLPFYAVVLHLGLLALPLYSLRFQLGPRRILVVIAALAIPESALFLGAVSKEGLSIVAVTAAIAGYFYYFNNRSKSAYLMWAYAVSIAEFSRPGLGGLYVLALFVGVYPSFTRKNKRRVVAASSLIIAAGIWLILYGTFREQATDAYQTGKQFLLWFEENMGNEDSAIKSGVRGFFALVFNYDEPTLSFILLAAFSGFMKAVVYFLAIPVISLPPFSEMPSMTWAMTWQFAVSGSSLVMLYSAYKMFRERKTLTVDQRCLLWFGFALFFLFSISTFIFHVRYRAPGVVAILIAIWLARGKGSGIVVPLTLPAVCAACYAIAVTS